MTEGLGTPGKEPAEPLCPGGNSHLQLTSSVVLASHLPFPCLDLLAHTMGMLPSLSTNLTEVKCGRLFQQLHLLSSLSLIL